MREFACSALYNLQLPECKIDAAGRVFLKVEPCDRSIFGFNLNACATKTGRFTVLGVMVYSTVMLGVKLKYVVFFWLGSWAKILCLVIKKKSLGDE